MASSLHDARSPLPSCPWRHHKNFLLQNHFRRPRARRAGPPAIGRPRSECRFLGHQQPDEHRTPESHRHIAAQRQAPRRGRIRFDCHQYPRVEYRYVPALRCLDRGLDEHWLAQYPAQLCHRHPVAQRQSPHRRRWKQFSDHVPVQRRIVRPRQRYVDHDGFASYPPVQAHRHLVAQR